MTFTDYIFESTALAHKTAIIDGGETSYVELYKGVIRTANIIYNMELKKGEKVILISDNSVFFITSYFGIIKSDCICVPLNPSCSSEDVKYIMDICDIKAVFVQKKFMKRFHELFKNITVINEDNLSFDSLPRCDSEYRICPDRSDVAVIMFTSGSTGKPKGVMLSHHNLMYNTNSIIEYLKLTEDDRIEVVLPFYYCYGTSLLHTHLRVGGSLVINNRFMFPATVIEDLKEYNCTGFAGVPSNFQILLRKTAIRSYRFPSLRYVTQAGGKLPQVFIEEILETFPKSEVYVMYGQTEATARLSYLPPELIRSKLGSIGKGIPGTLLKVIDKEGNEVMPGEIGEIVGSGGNIMLGYFNDEEETKKALKNGWLYTGDIATVDEDGFIYIVSREKQIIKSGGNRISPREIEDTISEISEIVEVVVIGVEDDVLGEAVKAYVVLRGESSRIDEKYIIDYCKQRLPSFKVPRYVSFLEALPKNSSGKVMPKLLHEIHVKNDNIN